MKDFEKFQREYFKNEFCKSDEQILTAEEIINVVWKSVMIIM